MKIAAFLSQDRDEVQFGLIEGERLICIEDPFKGDGIVKTGEEKAMADVVLVNPSFPVKAIGIGLNYRDHAKEFGLPIPQSPVVFMKAPTSVIGPGDYIIKPRVCKDLDYEAELAVVIGRECKNVSEDEVDGYILGYCCANDVTARDLQDKNGQWTIAKGFDTFMPLGPYISDEVDPSKLDIECRVNGKTVQKSNTSNLIFPAKWLVSWLSQRMTLQEGDVILTGTPSGVAHVKPGDVIEVEIEGLGVLQNTVDVEE